MTRIIMGDRWGWGMLSVRMSWVVYSKTEAVFPRSCEDLHEDIV